MLDDFNDLDSSAFLEDLESELESDSPPAFFNDEPAVATPSRMPRRKSKPAKERLVFGMTAIQRMVIAGMLLGSTCILGLFVMVVFEKMTLAF